MNHPPPDLPANPLGSPPHNPEPGRRYVTLLFADLSRSTELVELIEAEQYAAVLAALREIYHDVVPRHGGTVVRVQGDGLLALFGYPHTRESDGRDTVSAALELHHRVRGLSDALQAQRPPQLPAGRQLALHSGIHAGLVLLKHGDVELGRYELLGPVPHIAARLSDAAAAHQILVSEETLGPASRFFVTGPPQMLQVKGRAAPLLVYRVDALASPAQRQAGGGGHGGAGSAVFVGRQAELAQLLQAMDSAIAGQLRMVSVAGAPGMGKTRLIEHFLSRVVQRGCLVLRGYCDSGLGAQPLQPFLHMMQALAQAAPPPKPEAYAALFVQLSERQPLLLFVDDWQWADDASNRVLAELRARSLGRLLVVTSTRVTAPAADTAPAGLARGSTTVAAPGAAAAQELTVELTVGLTIELTIELPPLGDADAAAAISALLPAADPFVVAEISRQASGNPLFIEELCHFAARGGEEPLLGKTQTGAGWLTRLVESRVQHLPAAQAEMVRVAAVVGNVVPAWLLETITGQPADGPLLLGLAEQDFIFPGERAGTLRFKHGLTRDIIYESVGLATRQGLHLRIAQALHQHGSGQTAGEALEALAYHCGAGGDHEQAARYAEAAGDKALAASALDRARALYRAALAALDRLPLQAVVAQRWVAVAHRLARVYVFDPVRSELAVHERALQLAQQFGDVATTARARHWLSYIHYGLGDAKKAIAQGEQALLEARAAGDEKLAVQVVAALGEAHCTAADYNRAQLLLDEAIAVKKAHRNGNAINVGLAFSLVCRAYQLGDRGQFDAASACFDEAAACVAGATHEIGATVQGWRAAVLLWRGHWVQARAAAEDSARIAQATRSLAQLSIARAIAAYAGWMLWQKPASLQTIADVTLWLQPRASGLYRSLNHGWLCQGLAQGGQRAAARQQAALALRRARQRDLLGAAMAYRTLALDPAASGASAQHYLQRAFWVAQERSSAHERANTQLCAAQLALAQGAHQQARDWLEQAAAGFESMAMHWHGAQAQRLQAAVDAGAAPTATELVR